MTYDAWDDDGLDESTLDAFEAPDEVYDEALEIELGTRVYRALTGLSYGDKRVEAGELVSDLPEESVEWLLNDGHIREED